MFTLLKSGIFFKKIKKYALPALLVFIALMLAAFPEKYSQTTFRGLKIWAVNVLPSLLPFFFLTALLTSTGCLFTLAGYMSPLTRFLYGADGVAAYAQIMSFLSGYPVGLKIAADLYGAGAIGSRQATKMSAFCSTSGPLFIVGSVGTAMFGDKITGYILLFSHLLSSVLCGILFRFLSSDERAAAPIVNESAKNNVLYESVYSSVISVAVVGAFIALFYTFASILSDIGIFKPVISLLSPLIGENNAHGVALATIECTFACKMFALSPSALSTALACGAISLGGLSVWCQSAIYLNKTRAKFSVFALSKLVHTALSIIICYCLCLIFK